MKLRFLTMIKKIIALYVLIGVFVTMYAWSIDTSESKGEAWPVAIAIAVFWPIWLLLYATFG